MLSILNRYWVFCQKKQRNEGLPPTSNSIQHHIERANYQTMVWKKCLRLMRGLPSPLGNGWQMCDNNVIMPLLMTKEAAPVGIMELTSCKCEKSSCRSSHHCICRKNEMPCTGGAGAWMIRAAKIHILYKCSVMIVVTRKRENLRHYSLCKYK